MERPSDPGTVRLAEIVAALSLGIDLGFGQPMEHVLRQCLIATRLAAAAGLDEDTRADVYYTALLVNVGCHTDAHEQAKWFGDDIALKSGKYDGELRSVRSTINGLRMIGSGQPALQRFFTGVAFATGGFREVDHMIENHARVAQQFAERLGLRPGVCSAIGSAYEFWDGKGWPGALRADEVPIAARVAQIAEFLEVAHRVDGTEAAIALARRRAGREFDPQLSEVFCEDSARILADIDGTTAWDKVISAEPALVQRLSEDQFELALRAVADFVDLKSPYFHGHGQAVSTLAGQAAEHLGLDRVQAREVRLAGLVVGFGRLGVSNAIWDRRGPLGVGEVERVRMSPYLTERMLAQSPALARLGSIAVQHRERLDGSGYPRGLSGSAISQAARIVAVADAFQTMREERPHRPARSEADAAMRLRADVRAGRLDADAVDAVLAVAGHKVPRRREGPAGLTPREVEVLRLLTRGLSNKEIARLLVISPKTAGNHIEHIYLKIGASSRASAALFAMEHGLLAT
jgi:HD-GYP domain-containing protein (c-di-GMP phosphodiesterase class II)